LGLEHVRQLSRLPLLCLGDAPGHSYTWMLGAAAAGVRRYTQTAPAAATWVSQAKQEYLSPR